MESGDNVADVEAEEKVLELCVFPETLLNKRSRILCKVVLVIMIMGQPAPEMF